MATKKVSKRKGKTRSGTTGRVVKKAITKKKALKKKTTGRLNRRPKNVKVTPLQRALKVSNLLSDIADLLKDQTPEELTLIEEQFPRQSRFPRQTKDVIFRFKKSKLRGKDKNRDIMVTWRY